MILHTKAACGAGRSIPMGSRLHAAQSLLSCCGQLHWRLPPQLCRASSSNGSNGSNGSRSSGQGYQDASNAEGSFTSDDASSSKLRFNKRQQDLPAELQGLQIKDGLLVDEKTGKAINEFGATRFDVAVRAMRGELDPPPWIEVVGKPGDAKEAFVADVTACIGRVCEAEVLPEHLSVKERMGGKYVSVALTMTVRAPELINRVYQELGRDPRIIMKF